MNLGYFNYPLPVNEPVLQLCAGLKRKRILKKTIEELKSKEEDIPMYIGMKKCEPEIKSLYILRTKLRIRSAYFHAGDEAMFTRQLMLPWRREAGQT